MRYTWKCESETRNRKGEFKKCDLNCEITNNDVNFEPDGCCVFGEFETQEWVLVVLDQVVDAEP